MYNIFEFYFTFCEGMIGLELYNIMKKHYHKLDQTFTLNNISNEAYQVLMGSILGDGGITKQSRGKEYLFKELHGIEQKDYLEWKRMMLSQFCPCQISGKKPTFSTPTHPIFKILRNEFYNESEQRKSYIPLKYIEKLDALGLLVWYLDDGDTPHCPNINSVLFDEQNLKDVVEIINNKLDLSLSVRVKSSSWRIKKGYKPCKLIRFGANDRNKIMPIWGELFEKHKLPECMRYKLFKQHEHPTQWKNWEIEILQNNTDKTSKEIEGLLTNRSYASIKQKRKSLKIGKTMCYKKSLEYRFPNIAQEWHPTKNESKPSNVSPGSINKVWWQCKLEHEWLSCPNARTNPTTRSGCPHCWKIRRGKP
jgi:hypothetical protein